MQEDHPKSRFTKDDTGTLTTDSDKNTFTLYELQNCISSIIRFLKGTKVTISLAVEEKIVQTSLQSSGDIVKRMILSATDKM